MLEHPTQTTKGRTLTIPSITVGLAQIAVRNEPLSDFFIIFSSNLVESIYSKTSASSTIRLCQTRRPTIVPKLIPLVYLMEIPQHEVRNFIMVCYLCGFVLHGICLNLASLEHLTKVAAHTIPSTNIRLSFLRCLGLLCLGIREIIAVSFVFDAVCSQVSVSGAAPRGENTHRHSHEDNPSLA